MDDTSDEPPPRSGGALPSRPEQTYLDDVYRRRIDILHGQANGRFMMSAYPSIDDRVEPVQPTPRVAHATAAVATGLYLTARYGETLQPVMGAFLQYFS